MSRIFSTERINVDRRWMKLKRRKKECRTSELLLEFREHPEITYTRVRMKPCPVEIYSDVTNIRVRIKSRAIVEIYADEIPWQGKSLVR